MRLSHFHEGENLKEPLFRKFRRRLLLLFRFCNEAGVLNLERERERVYHTLIIDTRYICRSDFVGAVFNRELKLVASRAPFLPSAISSLLIVPLAKLFGHRAN